MKNTKLENEGETKFYVENHQISGKNHGGRRPKFAMIIQELQS